MSHPPRDVPEPTPDSAAPQDQQTNPLLDQLDDYIFKMGPARARQAMSMDLLTDALVLLGRHRVYTHAPTGKTKRDRDIDAAIAQLEHIRQLLRANLAGE
jgi:hypothetical protein